MIRLSPTIPVRAGLGGRADLPCNLTSPLPRDPAHLVLWYRSGTHKPLYSYDARGSRPSHWVNPSVLGSRASFHPTTSTLIIQHVRSDDEGTYRCRVMFKKSPTLTYTTNLTVIVPPRRLAVYTEHGVEAQSIVGPFTEGETLRLNCRAMGGSPPPAVTWWEGSTLLDMTSEVETPDLVTNRLVVPALTRRDLHRTLTCHAANSNLTAPQVTTVTLDMNFSPLWVRLLSSRDPLSAGRTYKVVCQAAGARPPATITWRLGPARLNTHSDKVSHEGNVTTSELQFTPQVRDGERMLSCEAFSPSVTTHPLVDDWLLDVHYVPEATLHVGRSLNLSNIEEGDDVYFECSIKANPWVYKVVWKHEGTELHHNITAGVIISNQSLVLQRVTRASSGNYYCVGSNIEGDGQSKAIHLRVKYAPVCREPHMSYHGAARHEKVNIPCHVDAHPRPFTYRWTFNNSGESVEIPQDDIKVGSSSSTVSYTPTSELDYGTLLCWGTNVVGQQRRPCVFHVFPAGRPDPVHNCSSFNLSVSVVHVRCVAGFDGGLPQTFTLELREQHTDTLIANTSNVVPFLSVDDLPPGLAFRGRVYSANAKGRSEVLPIQVYTLKDVAEKRTAAVKPSPTQGQSTAELSLTPIIAVILGVFGGLLVVVLVLCAVIRLRFGRRTQAQCSRQVVREQVGGEGETSPLRHPKGPTTTFHDTASPSPVTPRDGDEKNPDVIPLGDPETWLMEGVNPLNTLNPINAVNTVTTISNTSMPTTYTTMPQRACGARGDLQAGHAEGKRSPCSAGDVHYAELMLRGGAASPQLQRHDQPRGGGGGGGSEEGREGGRGGAGGPTLYDSPVKSRHDPDGVIYASLDHERGQGFRPTSPRLHHPRHHLHTAYTQPVLIPNTPTRPCIPSTVGMGPSRAKEQQYNSWSSSSASLDPCDAFFGDPEAAIPFLSGQKESSV
ncbi:nephrin-like [Eriocheir sinensis]|uniref:nephrin-like n=1 Tax=Eriocheir sinensis TaxID=95602 RepID=UPI0021C69F3A|nr:nephrin-like [Eriocheir sinensis]